MSDTIIDRLPDGSTNVRELKAGFQPGNSHTYHPHKNTRKQGANLGSVRKKIMYISQWNNWKHFITLTINKSKFVGMTDKKIIEKILQFIQNENKRPKVRIKYLLVAEYGENGQLHFHGLTTGLLFNDLRELSADETIPEETKKMIATGAKVYEWTRYSEKFGFSYVTRLRGAKRAGRYMIKELNEKNTKLMDNFNGHAFFHSNGINCEAERILRGPTGKTIEQPDFETEWCKGLDGIVLEDAMEYINTDDTDLLITGK